MTLFLLSIFVCVCVCVCVFPFSYSCLAWSLSLMNFFFPVCSVSLDCRLISAFETSSFPKCGHFLNLPLPASSVSVERAGIHQYRLFWSSLLGFFHFFWVLPATWRTVWPLWPSYSYRLLQCGTRCWTVYRLAMCVCVSVCVCTEGVETEQTCLSALHSISKLSP